MITRRHFAHLLAGTGILPALPSWASGPVPLQPRFSVMLWTLKQMATFDRSLGIVAEAGYAGVELVGEFHPWTASQRQAFAQRLQTLGLRVDAMSGVSAGFAVPAQTAQFLTEFQQQVEAATALRCGRIILLSGNTVKELPAAAQMQCSAENLQRAADMAAKSGLDIVIEPIDALENPTIFLQSVQTAFEIASNVNRPNVNVLYDVYHQQRGAGNLLENFEHHLDRVKLIHIADVPGRHEPGTGEINYSNLYAKLAELQYSGWIAMEFYPAGDPVRTLRQAREGVQQAYATHAGA